MISPSQVCSTALTANTYVSPLHQWKQQWQGGCRSWRCRLCWSARAPACLQQLAYYAVLQVPPPPLNLKQHCACRAGRQQQHTPDVALVAQQQLPLVNQNLNVGFRMRCFAAHSTAVFVLPPLAQGHTVDCIVNHWCVCGGPCDSCPHHYPNVLTTCCAVSTLLRNNSNV